LNTVDLPTLGRPTIPIERPIEDTTLLQRPENNY
jgi:hypothetical protein